MPSSAVREPGTTVRKRGSAGVAGHACADTSAAGERCPRTRSNRRLASPIDGERARHWERSSPPPRRTHSFRNAGAIVCDLALATTGSTTLAGPQPHLAEIHSDEPAIAQISNRQRRHMRARDGWSNSALEQSGAASNWLVRRTSTSTLGRLLAIRNEKPPCPRGCSEAGAEARRNYCFAASATTGRATALGTPRSFRHQPGCHRNAPRFR
jgi:hypothetical protein